ncbi:hypothetical protein [Methylobacterium durans]|nr:hypothetical protein [Methylobacterium durans]
MGTADGSRDGVADETRARREQIRAHVRTVLRKLATAKAGGQTPPGA